MFKKLKLWMLEQQIKTIVVQEPAKEEAPKKAPAKKTAPKKTTTKK